MIPFLGADVLYRLADLEAGVPRWRPGRVVSVPGPPYLEGGAANVLVFLDPSIDPETDPGIDDAPPIPWTFAEAAIAGDGVGAWQENPGGFVPGESTGAPESAELTPDAGVGHDGAEAPDPRTRRVFGRRS